ncbi:MAG TPA: TldD/PmbA family protein [Candidatus Deferrimicrobiaceae bacterium]|nr:TldD/PmbA family protein [Candidatus Deferrimicrobiaceae bacterium]
MIDQLTKLTDVAIQKLGAQYAEARGQTLNKTMLTLKEQRMEAAKQGVENGVAFRVLVDGAWGFASIGSTDKVILTAALSDACRMAKLASTRLKNPIKLAESKAIQNRAHSKPKRNPADVQMEEKIKTALEVNNAILGFDQRIKSCSMDYLDLMGSTVFVNSDGSRIEQDKLYVWSRITASAQSEGLFTFSREEIGSTAGYELFIKQTPEALGEKVAKRAIEQLSAKSPRGGKFPVVLGPNVVGVFVHEAFGHLAEADLALSGGVLASNMGKKIGSPLVTFFDDGTIEGTFGSFKYDDEGVPSQKTLLIKDGVVTGLMHNRETAQKFNVQPTGNARAEDFRVEPIIRMRCTYMAPRDQTLEELVEEVKSGYYFKSFRGGQANLDGTFQVGIQEGYEIHNGEIGDAVRNASISGNTLETLHHVDGVGKDFALDLGRCGKGQTAFIGDGGPHIRVKEMVVGGSA